MHKIIWYIFLQRLFPFLSTINSTLGVCSQGRKGLMEIHWTAYLWPDLTIQCIRGLRHVYGYEVKNLQYIKTLCISSFSILLQRHHFNFFLLQINFNYTLCMPHSFSLHIPESYFSCLIFIAISRCSHLLPFYFWLLYHSCSVSCPPSLFPRQQIQTRME